MAKQHARFSPSRLDGLSLCIRFKYKERGDGSDEEGTLLHAACETGSLAGLTEQQKLDVTAARMYVDSLVAGNPERWKVFREAKLTLGDLTYGHCDFLAVNTHDKQLVVADFKFTRVDSNHSSQVRTYAAAIADMLDSATTGSALPIYNDNGSLLGYVDVPHPDNLQQYTASVHVVAPRIGTEPFSQTYNALELRDTVAQEITELYERIDDPFLPPTPDEAVCGNCAHASRCPALNQVVAHAATDILGLPVPSTFDPGNTSVSDRDRALAQVLRGVFDNWSEQVSRNNTEYVKAGGTIPGFRLQSRSNGIKVDRTLTMAAIVELRKLGYTDEELLSACSLSVAELARTRAEMSGMTEGEAKEEIRNALGDGLAVESTSTFLAKVKRTKDVELARALLTEGGGSVGS